MPSVNTPGNLNMSVYGIQYSTPAFALLLLFLERKKYFTKIKNLFSPTGPFTTFEPPHQEIVEFYVVQKRRPTDFDAT